MIINSEKINENSKMFLSAEIENNIIYGK